MNKVKINKLRVKIDAFLNTHKLQGLPKGIKPTHEIKISPIEDLLMFTITTTVIMPGHVVPVRYHTVRNYEIIKKSIDLDYLLNDLKEHVELIDELIDNLIHKNGDEEIAKPN